LKPVVLDAEDARVAEVPSKPEVLDAEDALVRVAGIPSKPQVLDVGTKVKASPPDALLGPCCPLVRVAETPLEPEVLERRKPPT